MRIEIAKGFRKNQRGIIRAALVVAAANFPMPPRVTVRRMPKFLWAHPETGLPQTDGLIWPDKPREMLIAPHLKDADLFFAVSHEARHVSDAYTGKLEARDGRNFWNGRKVDGRTAYHKLPYEKTAIAYEKRLGAPYTRGKPKRK